MAIQTKGRLFFDIETSPNIGFFWQSGYKLQVPYTNIIKERAIICICYKWENDKKVNFNPKSASAAIIVREIN